MYVLRFGVCICFAVAANALAGSTSAEEAGDAPETKWEKHIIDFGRESTVSVAISPDGKTLAWGHSGNGRTASISLTELATKKVIGRLGPHAFPVTALCFSADRKRLISGDQQGFLCVWDVATLKQVKAARAHENKTTRIEISPDGKSIATAGNDERAQIWKEDLSEPIKSFEVDGGVHGVAFAPDKKSLVTTGNSTQLWSYDTGTQLERYESVYDCCFTPDGSLLLAVTVNGDFIALAYPELRAEWTTKHRDRNFYRIKTLPEASLCVLGGIGTLDIYDYKKRRIVEPLFARRGGGSLFEPAAYVTGLAVSKKGDVICAAVGNDAIFWRRVSKDQR